MDEDRTIEPSTAWALYIQFGSDRAEVRMFALREDAIAAAEADWDERRRTGDTASIAWVWDGNANDGRLEGRPNATMSYRVTPNTGNPGGYTASELEDAGLVDNPHMYMGDGLMWCRFCRAYTLHFAMSTPRRSDCWEVCSRCDRYGGPQRLRQRAG